MSSSLSSWVSVSLNYKKKVGHAQSEVRYVEVESLSTPQHIDWVQAGVHEDSWYKILRKVDIIF